jgi:hypothetical protein
MSKVKLESSHVQLDVIHSCTAAHQPQQSEDARIRRAAGARLAGWQDMPPCVPDRSGAHRRGPTPIPLSFSRSGVEAPARWLLTRRRTSVAVRSGKASANARRTGVAYTATLRGSSYQKAVGARDPGGD